jgi:hypothetical protein
MDTPRIEPVDPIECPWCHSKYAPRLYGWHEDATVRYTVRCLNCGAQGPKKEIGPLAIEAWNKRDAMPANMPDGIKDDIGLCAAAVVLAYHRKTHDHILQDDDTRNAALRVEKWLGWR